jgi:hypothetical protein
MIYIVIFVLLAIFVWMSYEFHRAPFIDRDGNIIKEKKNDSSAQSNDTYHEIF